MEITTLKYNLRPFSFNDAQAVIDLFNAHSLNLYGWKDSTLEDLMNDWTSPGINVEEVIRVVENDKGDIIGYIDVWDNTNPHVIKYVWGILHPQAWDAELYQEMLAWSQTCARERIDLAPEGTRVIISQGVSNKNTRCKIVLEEAGYKLVRHFYRMQIDLVKPPEKPELPYGLRIEPIDLAKELKEAILAMDDGFKDHWGYVERPTNELIEQWEHHLNKQQDFDPSLWFLAKAGDQIAGVCRCDGKTVEDHEMGWVNQLCVRKPWRRQGLGMALLLTAFNEFFDRGKQRVGLAVDASSLTSATRLYEKAGMHITQQYDTYELELRSGSDLIRTE